MLCKGFENKVVIKMVYLMTQRDIAIFLGIGTKTLYNWKKNKPNLYKTVMKGLAYDEIVELNEELLKKAKELQKKYQY